MAPRLAGVVVWMIVRAHRQRRSRSRRWLLYPVIAMLALASIGGGYETVREAADAKAYPMPGQLIDVGGHSLHLNFTGSGSPTVVLEPGGGEMSSVLGWITPAVARDTRICVYDRAGGDFADKPLIVLTAGSASAADLSAKQNALATLSTNSVHRVIDGATHASLTRTKGTPPPALKRSATSSHRSGAQGRWSGDPERSHTVGSILPKLAILLPPAEARVAVTFVAVLVALAITGAVSAQTSMAPTRVPMP